MSTALMQHSYALGHSAHELDRLSTQAVIFDPMTRDSFVAAGLTTGMRVLDVGCGSGDVAFLAAELVGPTGRVIAVDRSMEAIQRAESRARARDVRNVSFVEGDPAEMRFDREFDAIVGRLVLMYYPSPVEALRKLTRHLKTGGLMAFQEMDFSGCQSWPPCPTFDRCVYLARKAFELTGAHARLGLELHAAFVDAGFGHPEMKVSAAAGTGRTMSMPYIIAEVIRSLLPALEQFGVASSQQIQISTLEERLRQEALVNRSVLTTPTMIGTWARKG